MRPVNRFCVLRRLSEGQRATFEKALSAHSPKLYPVSKCDDGDNVFHSVLLSKTLTPLTPFVTPPRQFPSKEKPSCRREFGCSDNGYILSPLSACKDIFNTFTLNIICPYGNAAYRFELSVSPGDESAQKMPAVAEPSALKGGE